MPETTSVAIRAFPVCSASEGALARALALATAKVGPGTVATSWLALLPLLTRNIADLAARMNKLDRYFMPLRVLGASDEPADGKVVAAVAPTPVRKRSSFERYLTSQTFGGRRREAFKGPR